MFKIVLLFLALTGLQALPISRRLTKTHQSLPLDVQDDLTVPLYQEFRQGTEPSRRFIVDLNTGLVQDYISEMDRRTGLLSPSLGNGHGEMDRKHWFRENSGEEVPVQKIGKSWVRVEGLAKIPDGFRQGTEPVMPIRDGYRQGTERLMPLPDGFKQRTEPSMRLQDGFRQGTEPSLGIQKGFRQGTERFMPLLDGFKQGTEPSMRLQDGFRQGTEPSLGIQKGFRQGTERFMPIPDSFRQGTEPSQKIPNGFRQGTEPTNPENYRTEPAQDLSDGFRQGTEPVMPMHNGYMLGTEHFMPIPDGFRQDTEPSMGIPNGFRQGTEPSFGFPGRYRQVTEKLMPFRQGTEPTNPLHHNVGDLSFKDLPAVPSKQILGGFKPGAGPFMPVRDGDRHDTPENLGFMPILDGFRQGTEPTGARREQDRALYLPTRQFPVGFKPGAGPFMPVRDSDTQNTPGVMRFSHIQNGFRQGTEPSNPLYHKDTPISFNNLPVVPSNQILKGFKTGTGPFMPIRDGDRQDSKPSNHLQASFSHAIETSKLKPNRARCMGEVINGRCYVFNPKPMPFLEAQDSCKSLNPKAELAAVTNEDLHSRLVSMVTEGGQREPEVTWLGGTVKQQRGAWLDGSEWRYSDWMPGQPNIHTDKPVCVEMFRMGETWWTAADCDLNRASLCSYPVVA